MLHRLSKEDSVLIVSGRLRRCQRYRNAVQCRRLAGGIPEADGIRSGVQLDQKYNASGKLMLLPFKSSFCVGTAVDFSECARVRKNHCRRFCALLKAGQAIDEVSLAYPRRLRSGRGCDFTPLGIYRVGLYQIASLTDILLIPYPRMDSRAGQ